MPLEIFEGVDADTGLPEGIVYSDIRRIRGLPRDKATGKDRIQIVAESGSVTFFGTYDEAVDILTAPVEEVPSPADARPGDATVSGHPVIKPGDEE